MKRWFNCSNLCGHFSQAKNPFAGLLNGRTLNRNKMNVNMEKKEDENKPLLQRVKRSFSRQVSQDNPNRNRYTSFTDTKTRAISECVVIERHLNLFHAVGIMVGSVCGTGIFVSPTGVTRAVGSVGLTLCIWAGCGLFNLLLALCYAELGTAMPVAGGDYSYINHLLGPFPAFLCLWTICILIAPCATALMARTIGAYFTTLFEQDCNTITVVVVALWVTGTYLQKEKQDKEPKTEFLHFNQGIVVPQAWTRMPCIQMSCILRCRSTSRILPEKIQKNWPVLRVFVLTNRFSGSCDPECRKCQMVSENCFPHLSRKADSHGGHHCHWNRQSS